MLPQESAALVETVGVPEIRRTRIPVERSLVVRNPIDAEGNQIIMSHLKIQAAIVLRRCNLSWISRLHERDIRNAIQSATNTERRTSCAKGWILRS